MSPRKPRRQPQKIRRVAVGRRRLVATVLAVPGIALATLGIAVLLAAPEARPRHGSTRPHLGSLARFVPEPAPHPEAVGGGGAGLVRPALDAPVSSASTPGAPSGPAGTAVPGGVFATAASVPAAPASSGTRATASRRAPIDGAPIDRAPIDSAPIDSASWVREAALDPHGPDVDGRVLVVGRATEHGAQGNQSCLDAHITLWAIVTLEGEAMPDETISRELVSVAPELRSYTARAWGETPRQGLVEVASAPIGRDGRYIFAVDRGRLPEGVRLFATASRTDGEGRLAASSDRQCLPDVDDSPDRVDRPVLSLGTMQLDATRRIVVVARSGSATVPDARVDVDSDPGLVGTTDGAGRFECEVFAASDISVLVTRDGLSKGAARFAPASQKGVALELGEPVSLAVRVLGPDGNAVAENTVAAYFADGGGAVATASTGPDGRAVLEGLARGRAYSITASQVEGGPQPFESASVDVTVPADEVTIRLAPAAALDVDLQFEAGLARPIEQGEQDLTLVLERRKDDGTWESRQSGSSRERTRRYASLDPGTYRVSLPDQNGLHLAVASSEPVEVKAGPPARASVPVGHGRSVTGWVTDEQGHFIDAEVGFREATSTQTVSGGWVDLRLPAATMHLVVRAKNYQDRELTVTPDQSWLGEILLVPAGGAPRAD